MGFQYLLSRVPWSFNGTDRRVWSVNHDHYKNGEGQWRRVVCRTDLPGSVSQGAGMPLREQTTLAGRQDVGLAKTSAQQRELLRKGMVSVFQKWAAPLLQHQLFRLATLQIYTHIG